MEDQMKCEEPHPVYKIVCRLAAGHLGPHEAPWMGCIATWGMVFGHGSIAPGETK